MVDWILACARKTVVGVDGPSGATLEARAPGPQPHTQRLPHDDGDPVHFDAGASLEWCTTFQQREFKL